MNDDFFFINKNNVSEMCHLSTNICQLTPRLALLCPDGISLIIYTIK
jgi:hypothetical protein